MRRAIACLLALSAIVIAPAPFVGQAVPVLDRLAVPLPLVPAIAIVALLLDRRWAGTVAAVALLLSAYILLTEWWGDPPEPIEGRKLVIVTQNVAERNVDPLATARVLAASGADILLLQEVHGSFRPALETLRTRYPYGSACHGCSLAILSRLPIDRPRYRFRNADGKPYGPELVQTHLHLGALDVPIATVHLSRKVDAMERVRQMAMLADVTMQAGRGAMILGGDFNTTPWQASLRSLDDDMAPMARLTRAIFSFPAQIDDVAMPFPLLPIDHVYAGPIWASQSVQRLPAGGSDHYAVRVQLVLRR